jgi:hypothetical protein
MELSEIETALGNIRREMDKAHQKELQKNDLEVGLEKVASSVRPYYVHLAVGAAVVIVGLIAYMIYERSVRSSNTAAWSRWSLAVFENGNDAEALQSVGKELENSPAGPWALQFAADQELYSGSMLIFSDREEATTKLEHALDLYEQVIKDAKDDQMLLTRARYGAARTNECLFRIEPAIEQYQQIANSAMGNSALGKAAKERIEVLKKDETKDFYKWYATVEPFKPEPRKPLPNKGGLLDGLPGGRLPDKSDLNIPGAAKTPDAETKEPPKTDDAAKPAAEDRPPPTEREETPSRFKEKEGEQPKPEDPPTSEEKPPATPKPEEPKSEEPKSEEPKS